jgi:hypothetical protein
MSQSTFARLILGLLMFNVMAGAPVLAQDQRQQGDPCRLHPNRDANCTQAERARLHARFGLPPLERMFARQQRQSSKHSIVVGIMQLKLNSDIALIVRRNRDGVPEIEIRQSQQSGQLRRRAPLRATVSEGTWRVILERAQTTDVEFNNDRICVGGSSATFAMIDGEGRVRNRVGDVCPDDPGKDFVLFLATTAIAQLPYCAAVFPQPYNSPIGALEACLTFEGNKMAAAELSKTLEPLEGESFWSSNGSDRANEIQNFFAKDVVFSWSKSSTIIGAQAVAEFWSGDALFAIDFEPNVIRAETTDQVQVGGRIITLGNGVDDDGDSQVRGTFRSLWRRDSEGKFKMRSFQYRPSFSKIP